MMSKEDKRRTEGAAADSFTGARPFFKAAFIADGGEGVAGKSKNGKEKSDPHFGLLSCRVQSERSLLKLLLAFVGWKVTVWREASGPIKPFIHVLRLPLSRPL